MMITYFAWAAMITGILALVMVGRLVAGPTIPDRIVALDSINTMVVALMILLSLVYDSVVMVDVAIVYAALSFVGTMFIARHLEGGV
ncbi:MAG TPA: monovalent cation/H+ antiporter complex subunit F [Synergistales bacterium]|nr:cation:proton antiporter [Synergistaceae bacterium]HPA59409.1 monovalent cation/H+ antiporter complex subunit F [Synergistales bacterium]HQO82441.1 monovalent cation/H+ antiporter complex subunit F [Synergistales bacterium]HQQ10077.1 monovalent cation/H+ antiporter complex subunit F [Synergistales bacterium]